MHLKKHKKKKKRNTNKTSLIQYFEKKYSTEKYTNSLISFDFVLFLLCFSKFIGVCSVLTSQSDEITNNKNGDRISAIVSDSAFCALNEEIEHVMRRQVRFLPSKLTKPTMKLLDILNQFIYGYSVFDVSVIDCVSNPNFTTPIFLVHSNCDSVVPVWHAHNIYEKCQSKTKRLWIIESGDHCGGFFVNPKKFTNTITRWVEQVLDNELVEREQQKAAELKAFNNDFNNNNDTNDINASNIDKDELETEGNSEKLAEIGQTVGVMNLRKDEIGRIYETSNIMNNNNNKEQGIVQMAVKNEDTRVIIEGTKGLFRNNNGNLSGRNESKLGAMKKNGLNNVSDNGILKGIWDFLLAKIGFKQYTSKNDSYDT